MHLGNNRTCCKGSFFINAEPGRCIMTLLMINIPVVATIYLTFDEVWVEGFPDEESFIWRIIVLVLLYLAGASNYCMIWTAMTEPGIVPGRRWPSEVASRYDEPKDKTDYYTWFIGVNQRVAPHNYKLTFCKTCQIF